MVAQSIKDILTVGVGRLGEREYLNPILDAQLLLASVIKVDRNYLYGHLEEEVSAEDVRTFLALIDIRAKGYPLQYILKSQEFMGLELFVSEGVLIPRPDTEILVEKLIEICKSKFSDKSELKILEIGTGSGAIAISLAYNLENAQVYTVDIADAPLEVAKANAERYGLQNRVKLLKGDMFEPLSELQVSEKFDIIVSNPPYIASEEIDKLQIEVATFEPRLALDGGVDGLYFYREITAESTAYLNPHGILAFEIGYDQAEAVKTLMEQDYEDIELISDYGNHDRVLLGYKKIDQE